MTKLDSIGTNLYQTSGDFSHLEEIYHRNLVDNVDLNHVSDSDMPLKVIYSIDHNYTKPLLTLFTTMKDVTERIKIHNNTIQNWGFLNPFPPTL